MTGHFYYEVKRMNIGPENKTYSVALWISALAVLLTFLVLDAGALAWNASLISGHQLMAELFTFLVVLSGAAITVWKLRVR
jgi:hypothetical protein